MPRRKTEGSPGKEYITQDVLLSILRTGAILAIAVVAPNVLQVVNSFVRQKKEWDRFYPSSLNRQILKLWRKGYVEVAETADGQVVTITDKGKKEVLKYDLENISVPRQDRWDSRWRMVIFDIPNGYESIRRAFREKLKNMGFFQMQKSVYISPYPCEREIKYLREVYGIPHFVKLASIDSLENSADLERFFHL